MRWDRLFADLEGTLLDEAAAERDVLADELADEEWAAVAARDLVWGEVQLEVRGAGWLHGTVVRASDAFVVLQTGPTSDVVVARGAILAWRGGRGRPDTTGVTAGLGWRQLFRAARDTGDAVRCDRTDGAPLAGRVLAVAADAVRLDDGTASTWVPYAVLTTVRSG